MKRTLSRGLILNVVIGITLFVSAGALAAVELSAGPVGPPPLGCSPPKGALKVFEFDLDVDSPQGLTSPPLRDAARYFLVVEGTYAFNRTGGRTDGRMTLVNGERAFSRPSGDGRYCTEIVSDGTALNVALQDTYLGDNEGALLVTLYQLK